MGITARFWDRLLERREEEGAPPLTAGSVASLATPTTGSDPTTTESDVSPGSQPPPAPIPVSESASTNGHRNGQGDGSGSTPTTAAGPTVPTTASGPLTDAATPFDNTGSPSSRSVPTGLEVAASWSWRVILIGALIYCVGRVLGDLAEVVVPVAIATLLAAMLSPVADRLRRWGLPRGLATAVTVLGGLALIAGALTLIFTQIVSQGAVLSSNVGAGLDQLSRYLQNGPLHVGAQYFSGDAWLARIQSFLAESESSVASYAAEVTTRVGHFVAGFAITLFALFYFLYDGRGIFEFVLRFFPREVQARVDHAAGKGWRSLSHYVRATILVALSDAVGILIAALLIGVPVAPALAALVFIGAFVPLVGGFVSGFVAVVVALVALGWVQALIMFGAIILVMQIEGHILQPFLLGRAVKLHPLAVLLAIAIGIIVAGIVGALVAVPILAFTKSFVQYLRGAPEPAAVRFRWSNPRHRELSAGAAAPQAQN